MWGISRKYLCAFILTHSAIVVRGLIFDACPKNVISSDLNGKRLRLATQEQAPFTILDRNSAGEIINFRGYCFEIIKTLQDIYNFSFTIEEARDRITGIRLADGSWNGLMGMIIGKEIDFGAAALSITHSRAKVIDFTSPFYEEPTAILIPPAREDSKLLACIKPFQPKVWIGLLLVLVVVPCVLWTQIRCTSRLDRSELAEVAKPNLFRQYLFVLAVVSSQSGQKVAAGNGPRLLAAVWCLCAVVFVYVYVGILVSVLSVPKLRPLIDSVEDLPSSNLLYGTRRATSTEAILSGATDGIFRTIGDEFLKRPELLTSSDLEGVQRVVNGSYAYIIGKSYLEIAIMEDFLETGQCRLTLAKEDFYKRNFAFPVPQGSSLPSLFNKKIRQMMEGGLTEYWRKKYSPPKYKCTDPNRKQATRRLTLNELQSAFLVLAVGILLATLAFMTECTIAKPRMD